MEPVKLYNMPFGKGENHIAADSTMPQGFARSIVNFNIDDQGVLSSRDGFISTGFPDAHSPFVTRTGVLFAVSGNALCVAQPPANWTPVPSMGGVVTGIGSRVWWWEHADTVYYSDGVVTGLIRAGAAYPWGVANPTVYKADALTWITRIDARGEESGAVLGDPTGDPSERVYKPTGEVGTDEFKAARGTALFRLNGDPKGRICETKGLTPFPPAAMIGLWKGRAWGVVGNYVVYSRALHYGLHDLAYDYFEIPATITAFGAVEDGMFIGTAETVYFVKGFEPTQWKLDPRSDCGAFYGSQVYVPTEHLDNEALNISPGSAVVFAWLSKHGLCYGVDGGDVRVPSRAVVRIEPGSSFRTSLVKRDTVVQIVAVKQ